MEKLTINQASAYLPHKVRFVSTMDKPLEGYGKNPIWTCDGITKLFGDYCLTTSENNDAYSIESCRLLLRPLSDLTKPIEHNDERFVPLVEIAKMEGGDDANTFQTFKRGLSFNSDCLGVRYKIGQGTLGSENEITVQALTRILKCQISYNGEFTNKQVPLSEYFKITNKLFEWHFNVFNLPQELFVDLNTLQP